MGLYLSGHIGPYIQCTVRTERIEIEAKGCTNPTCAEFLRRARWGSAEGFCSKCGTKRGITPMLTDVRPDFREVIQGESLTEARGDRSGDTLFLIPNTHRSGVTSRYIGQHETVHLDLSTVDMKAEVEAMKKAFEEEVALLEKAFDDVTIKWGFHLWYS